MSNMKDKRSPESPGEGILATNLNTDDNEKELEVTLRPKSLQEFIGQTKIKENLQIFIKAALQRNETLDHVLLLGPPGLGKTTLAMIIANELGVSIRTTSGPALEKAGDFASIITSLQDGDVLFIDEIHRLNRNIEEILYPAMEEFALDIVIGKGPGAKILRVATPKFTLIGATTRTALLTSPLRDRFEVQERLDYYPKEEIQEIVLRSAGIIGVKIDIKSAVEIASRARGTPRIANRLLKRIRDYTQVKADGDIDIKTTSEALEYFGVDDLGLDKIDLKILKILTKAFQGNPVGLNTIAAAVGEESDTIESVYEPYLMQLGLINRTPKGRVATERAFEHLNILPGKQDQTQSLF